MASSSVRFLPLVLFFLMPTVLAAPYLTNKIFDSQKIKGRHMQDTGTIPTDEKPSVLTCPVDMRRLNYTIITSRCLGPNYQRRPCCSSFKKLSCPVSDFINDVDNNDCATMMFAEINYYGHYPVGLFYDMCIEGPKGLDCSKFPAMTVAQVARLAAGARGRSTAKNRVKQ